MNNIRQQNILIVDDDYNMREGLIDALSDEYAVLGAGEGKEAIDMVNKNSIDVVLLDIKLPDIDGFEVFQQIRKINNNLIIILITAYGSKEIVIQALHLNADDYFDKPIDIKNLKTRIKSLLDLKENTYNFREYPLDIDERFDKVKELLKTNNGKYKLNEIANEVGLSPKYLSRIFKKNNGKSFTQLSTQIKMEYAKHLLKTTNLTIDQIGYEVGYSHWSSFTRRFKREVKCSPVVYRKMIKMETT